jgi:anti-anti-sigma factor
MMATEHTAELRTVEDRLGLIVEIPGDINTMNSAEISAAAIAAWEQKGRPRRLILDLTNVQHMDSSGVGALMEIRHRIEQANSHLVLRGLQDAPRRLLERTGIARLFDSRDTVEESSIILPASRRERERDIEDLPPQKRPRRALWVLVWICLVGGALAGIGAASYPTLQRYHAQLEQIPVLSGLMGAMDKRVEAMEQELKGRFDAWDSRWTSHLRSERRQQAEMVRRNKELASRLDQVEAAQRETGARMVELQQKLEQQSSNKEEEK